MSNLVLILGESGSGKSTSIKGLDPQETIVLNILGKRLPFKGSNSLYNASNKNLINKEKFEDSVEKKTWEKTIDFIENISEKFINIKNVVIDDATYLMRREFFSRVKDKGLNV
jgi:predicted kinase